MCVLSLPKLKDYVLTLWICQYQKICKIILKDYLHAKVKMKGINLIMTQFIWIGMLAKKLIQVLMELTEEENMPIQPGIESIIKLFHITK